MDDHTLTHEHSPIEHFFDSCTVAVDERAWRTPHYRLKRLNLRRDGHPTRSCHHLAQSLLPGPDYLEVLSALHRALQPKTYVEIGVNRGNSLKRAPNPALRIGIDPCLENSMDSNIGASGEGRTILVPQRSEDFFPSTMAADIFERSPIDFAFVDGLHHFEAALRDLLWVEQFSGPGAVAALHDTVPLSATTSARDRSTRFWTGDVWKVLVALDRYRPDLRYRTIMSPPSGLTVVWGFDPSNSFACSLRAKLNEVTRSLAGLPFTTPASRRAASLWRMCAFREA